MHFILLFYIICTRIRHFFIANIDFILTIFETEVNKMAKRQGITAKDIAEVCEVSQATVSYVINQTEGKRVSEAKRQEILQVARELNYFPNHSAQSMRQQRCTSIGLICGNNYDNAGFGNTLRGIKKYFDEAGYTLTLLSDSKDPEAGEILKNYYSNSIAGVIYIAFDTQVIDTSVLDANKIPYVLISENGVYCSKFEPQKAFENVIRDCILFCKDNHLSRIRYFTRSINGRILRNKYDLIIKAIQDIYPESDFERIICDIRSNRDEEIIVPMEEYLKNHDFDIAITANQRFGILMQNCILKKGISVPQNPRHICLASSPFLLTVYPKISSLEIPLYEMGLYAAELILALSREEPVNEKLFECRLIHGDTTKL